MGCLAPTTGLKADDDESDNPDDDFAKQYDISDDDLEEEATTTAAPKPAPATKPKAASPPRARAEAAEPAASEATDGCVPATAPSGVTGERTLVPPVASTVPHDSVLPPSESQAQQDEVMADSEAHQPSAGRATEEPARGASPQDSGAATAVSMGTAVPRPMGVEPEPTPEANAPKAEPMEAMAAPTPGDAAAAAVPTAPTATLPGLVLKVPKPVSPRIKAIKQQASAMISPTLSPRQVAAINASKQSHQQRRPLQLQHPGTDALAAAAPSQGPEALIILPLAPPPPAPVAPTTLQLSAPALAPAAPKVVRLAPRPALMPMLAPLPMQQAPLTGAQSGAALAAKPRAGQLLLAPFAGPQLGPTAAAGPLALKPLALINSDAAARSGGGTGSGRGAAVVAGKPRQLMLNAAPASAVLGSTKFTGSMRAAACEAPKAATPGPAVAALTSGSAAAAAAAAAALAPKPGALLLKLHGAAKSPAKVPSVVARKLEQPAPTVTAPKAAEAPSAAGARVIECADDRAAGSFSSLAPTLSTATEGAEPAACAGQSRPPIAAAAPTLQPSGAPGTAVAAAGGKQRPAAAVMADAMTRLQEVSTSSSGVRIVACTHTLSPRYC
jgi:hypothetical protein